MLKNPLLLIALIITGAIAVWGIVDTTGLAAFSSHLVSIQFTSRAWVIMLAVSFMLVTSVWLALSRYGRIKLGKDDDEPEFSTISWLTMLFAAGMGVGLLYWGTAEPCSSSNSFSCSAFLSLFFCSIALINVPFVTLNGL